MDDVTRDRRDRHLASSRPHCPRRLTVIESIVCWGRVDFGTVYLAHDQQLHRAVAIKVPHPKLVQREYLESCIDEARVVAKLDHSNIVPVFDAGSTDEFPCYIVSRYIQGMDLAKHLQVERPSYRQAATLVADVADALHHAHKHGLVHRDVKPGQHFD